MMPKYLLLNITLALLIFYNAELGRMLGIQGEPLPISVVWPSTGFALAALLLFDLQAWPGVFFGNFCYNFHQLCIPSVTTASFLTAIVVTMGSLLQALAGHYVMRKYSSKPYFNTVRDVVIFLIPGGLIACLIAPTIGTIALYIYEGMISSWRSELHLWLTFWIGDTMGVYIFTPLIVVWSLHKITKHFFKHLPEAAFIALSFAGIAYLAIFVDFSLAIFFLPLSLMITYHYGMHGATLATFLMTILLIIPFLNLSYPTTATSLVSNPLLFLVLLLEIIVATNLILAAINKERRLP